ncbi:hypothetical protein CPB85DRAFT_1255887 [Mucidula mucida]|nr:hypothetical protein CPB85DRAFT_1255887 [Mucidula mucida]
MTSSKWGPRRSILALLPVLLAGPYVAWRHHTTLPEPLPANVTGISEARILEYARVLSEDMGFRTVGTREHAAADTWMTGVLEDIRERCVSNEKVACEVWRQEGNGSHRFDIMNTRLYKSYVGLSNFVVRLSAKANANSTEHAVLLNAHLDSQLPGPGAADDAISCGVMLDIINVLLAEDEWEPTYSAIFLFNNAEESLQDGSHLFSTQHPIAPSVRAVVNLEAAGTTGREILFQATSEQMIEAYSHVPRPFGTVFASDIFGSGIIMSDTDFRQFQEYLNVTGLDMAIIGHSYFYHTRADVIANIQTGVAQHMGENALALVRHLTSSKSPLPTLVEGYTKPSTVYWSHVVGPFVVYSAFTAKLMYGATLLLAIFLKRAGWNNVGKGMTLGVLSFLGALLGANAVALGMVAIGRGMSWFKNEVGSVILFGPGAIVGALSAPILFSIQTLPSERAVFEGVIMLNLLLAFVVQLAGIGSASLMWLTGLPVLVGLVVNDLVSKDAVGVSLVGYAVGGFIPLVTGTLVLLPTLEVFVPLTGRMSAEAPADHLIATIVTVIGTLMLPLLAPFTVRFLHVTPGPETDGEPQGKVDIESGRRGLKGGIVRCSIACLAMMAVYAKNQVYDEMHMRRVFVLRTENITTGEHHLHMAASDAAPGFPALVADVASAIPTLHGEAALEGKSLEYFEVEMNDYNGDWDPLYPFSAFLTPYKIPLSTGANADTVSYWHDKFTVQAVEDVRDVIKGERRLTVRIRHPGLIWTVIAFDAHVLWWNLDGNPPPERARHHIKEASFYGKDEWEVKMVVKMEDNAEGLQEGAMWPGKKRAYESYLQQAESEDGVVYSRGGGEAPTMALFKELDEWLDERMAKAVDATLIGAVAGVETI